MLPTSIRRSADAAKPVSIAPPPASVTMLERHFTLKELAEKWGFSYCFVHEHFRDEPGIIRAQRTGTRRGTRDYGTVRVPESVALRVYSRMVVSA